MALANSTGRIVPKKRPKSAGKASRGLSTQPACRLPVKDSDDSVLCQFLRALHVGGAPMRPFDEHPDLPVKSRQRVINRLEAAWAEGLLRITPEQYADVLMCLLPEDAVVNLPTGPGSTDPVGSVGRIAAYRERASRRETTCGKTDVDTVRNDRLAVRVKNRVSGRGIKTAGFERTKPDPLPPAMYRDAEGKWFELV